MAFIHQHFTIWENNRNFIIAIIGIKAVFCNLNNKEFIFFHYTKCRYPLNSSFFAIIWMVNELYSIFDLWEFLDNWVIDWTKEIEDIEFKSLNWFKERKKSGDSSAFVDMPEDQRIVKVSRNVLLSMIIVKNFL